MTISTPLPDIQLDDEQRKVVQDLSGRRAVIAGAGSGKTRVFAASIKALIDSGVDPQGVVCVAFTRKAAEEIKSRLENYGCRDIEQLWLGTIHHVCNGLLQKAGKRFRIVGAEDSEAYVKAALTEVKPGAKDEEAEVVCDWIERWNHQLYDPSLWAYCHLGESERPVFRLVVHEYQKRLENKCCIDFGEILRRAHRLLHGPDSESIRQHFTHVFVDEYQDVSAMEAEILEALASGGNMMVVGDPNQSIYCWRGSRPHNIEAFLEKYPGAKCYSILTNYRSGSRIVHDSSAMLGLVESRRCIPAASNGSGEVQYHSYDTDVDEAEAVVKEIRNATKAGRALSDIAVLLRTNDLVKYYKKAFRQAGIAYQGLKITDSLTARAAIDFLVCYSEPHAQALSRLQKLLCTDGDTPEQAAQPTQDEPQTPFYEKNAGKLLMAVRQQGPSDIANLLKTFWTCVPERLVDETVMATILSYIGEHAPEVQGARAFADFLAEKLDSQKVWDGVFVGTIHASKGLEYPTVFLPCLNDGLIPFTARGNEDAEHVAEEKRLLYVGMTRAIERLVLSFPYSREIKGPTLPQYRSRFLDGLFDSNRNSN